ncbi:DsbA family protein [Alteromonas sp. a30]|uniref:DsbA family protein n=1 Tax=Alteromonas sp. a30 TaxID=2730917 RepID=UPI002283256A|nr:DsbA family protein [Alteromonas sp. a30]MCY7295591.1 hypothetical protein [Alteromonas sp. a30]
MGSILMPYVAKAISSNKVKQFKYQVQKFKRVVSRKPPTLDIFLRIDDPYSFLLVQVLPAFLHRFAIEARFHTLLEVQQDMYPALDMWREYALKDASHLARLYELDYPFEWLSMTQAPSTLSFSRDLLEQASARLLQAEASDTYLNVAKRVFCEVWLKQTLSDLPSVSFADLSEKRHSNEQLLKRKGHYFGAMMYFEGEWYWGIDRLDHLEQRLIDAGLTQFPQDKVRFNLTYRDFCQTPAPSNEKQASHNRLPLTIYWSARSPYSYLGLLRAVALAEHYQLPLEVKPVLPMMMRGMHVPQNKKMYIFHDAKREADKFGIPYGFIGDPLGPAVERCYALLNYARAEDKLLPFLLSFAKAVNSEGIRAETDKGMQRILSRCGLSWSAAQAHINGTHWKAEVEDNLNEMMQIGCWGVPSFRYGELILWGQDRLGILEHHIQKNTSTPR